MKKLAVLFTVLACATLVSAVNFVGVVPTGTASISGTITDSVTGLPVAGAIVSAGRCGRMATTGDDGTYTIANLPAGDYTIKAWKCQTYVAKTYPTTVHVDEGQAVTGIDIALRPMGGGGGGNGTISGTVYDAATNEPIAGAKVTTGGCRGQSATTGDDGTYTITGLADGSYTVKAMKSGYRCATYPTPVEIINQQPVTGIDFYLETCNHSAVD